MSATPERDDCSLSESKPAVLGGSPAVTLDHSEALRWPIISDEDREAVMRVLDSGELSINQEVAALEDDYRSWLGIEHAVAHCNGTSAILAALHALGVGPGDEVIVPAATWWASVVPVLHCGGIPVFAETEEACMGLDPDDVARKITSRTRAIVVVHLFGMPSKMDELLAICEARGVRVLEDASHAHGALYRGRPVGTLGHAAVFSMQANKLVPAGEGGMFVTNDRDLWENVIRFGHYERLLSLDSPNRRFAATGFGYKFRIAPLSASVARVQLRHLKARNRERNEAIEYLSRRLERLGFRTFLPPGDVHRVYFEYLIACDESRTGLSVDALVRSLVAEGARVQKPRYPLLHRQPLLTEGHWAQLARLPIDPSEAMRRYDPEALPRTARAAGSLLKLPNFPRASRELLDQYATAFEKVLAHASALPQ